MRILPNGIAVIPNDTHISKWVEESGRLDHDQNMLPLLNRYIPSGGVVVDAGAFIGDHTLHYSRLVGGKGKVYAFEPNPIAFECLAYNMEGKRNVKVSSYGLSDKGTSIGIAQSDNVGASHAINKGDITCTTIDALNLERCDFIKIDCEGMEPLILDGAIKTIERHKPTLLIEVNAGALMRQGFDADFGIFSRVRRHGYNIANIYPDQPLVGPQFDIICTQ